MTRALAAVAAPLVLGALVLGCGGGQSVREVTPEDILARAERRVEKGDNLTAIEELNQLAIDYPGVAFIDRVVYLLGVAYMQTKEYVEAEAQFSRLLRDYPFSEYADDAAFLIGECYYRQKPSPNRDVTMGEEGIERFQRFLRDYPGSDRAPEARAKIQDLREILAVKKFLNGRQYYRHKRYTSAVVYLRAVWEDYPEAEIVPEALVLLARALDRIERRDEACEVLLLLEGLPQTEERDDYLRDARDLRKDWKCPQGNQTADGGA